MLRPPLPGCTIPGPFLEIRILDRTVAAKFRAALPHETCFVRAQGTMKKLLQRCPSDCSCTGTRSRTVTMIVILLRSIPSRHVQELDYVVQKRQQKALFVLLLAARHSFCQAAAD